MYDCETEYSFLFILYLRFYYINLTNDSILLLDLYASINVFMWLAYTYQISAAGGMVFNSFLSASITP